MGKRGATNRRDQTQKDRELSRVRTVQEMRRSSMAEPERNRVKYKRSDFRNAAQRGIYQED